MLDLSRPSELWITMEKLLTVIKTRVDSVIREAQSQNPSIKDQLKAATWERLGEDLPDRDMLEPLLVPFFIIGSKYDQFQVLHLYHIIDVSFKFKHYWSLEKVVSIMTLYFYLEKDTQMMIILYGSS